MLDPLEASFLRSIAEEPDDDTSRLVFADWLEERGESARAEFIRVQCELASAGLAEERRHAPRLRQRALLDAHRQEWCRAVGVPVEDVRFERGLIAGARPCSWEGGKLLHPVIAPRLVALTELDLSGLRLGDDGLATFADTARFPALRKLILSDNGITDAGAAALASAAGLPRLDTVYLFKNPTGTGTRLALERASGFLLTNLDLGEPDDGYCMSPGEAEMGRRQWVRTQLLPVVSGHFKKYERLQSAMLCVAQYWADEADDAVHGTLAVSELFEPTLDGARGLMKGSDTDPNVPHTKIIGLHGERGSLISLYGSGVRWDDNSGAIPLWAAFAPEAGNQDSEYSGAYAPAVMFYRHGGYEFLPMLRPHLDGVRPEWDEDE